MKFVVSFLKTIQVTEDKWREYPKTLIGDENMTIGQIRDWFLKDMKLGQNGKMDDMTISEPDEVVS